MAFYYYVSINAQIPLSVPDWQTPFVEPLACSVHAVNLGEIQREDIVVVSGCGPLGLGMVAAAKLKSPKTLIALDLYDWKVSLPIVSTTIVCLYVHFSVYLNISLHAAGGG